MALTGIKLKRVKAWWLDGVLVPVHPYAFGMKALFTELYRNIAMYMKIVIYIVILY